MSRLLRDGAPALVVVELIEKGLHEPEGLARLGASVGSRRLVNQIVGDGFTLATAS
jgi:hypothetical protein